MIFKIIFYLIFVIISQFITYKIMKMIDKRERKKLRNWEDSYINELIEHRKNLESLEKKK